MPSLYIPSFSEKRIVAQSRGADSCAPNLWRGCVFAAPLDEPGGLTAFDVSGYRNNGTLTSMDAATDHVVTPMGRVLDFDGDDDRVVLPASSVLKVPLPITVSVWAKPTGVTAMQRIFRNDNFGVVYLGLVTSIYISRLYCDFGDGTGGNRRGGHSGAVLTSGVWQHWVWDIRGAENMAFYLNAKSVAMEYDGTGGAMAYSAGAGAIGNFGDETQNFLGQLALLTIHSRILRPSEILRLYTDPGGMYRLRRRVQVRGAAVGTTIRWPWQLRRHRRMAGAR